MRGLYDWHTLDAEDITERHDYSNYSSRPPTREGGRRSRVDRRGSRDHRQSASAADAEPVHPGVHSVLHIDQVANKQGNDGPVPAMSVPCDWKSPGLSSSDWNDLDSTEILLEDCFRSRENPPPYPDRATMIEAASRHLLRRQESQGSLSYRRNSNSDSLINSKKDSSSVRSLNNLNNSHREEVGSSSREFADLSNAFGFGNDNSSGDYKHLKRPPSRKKDPSQSAVAGLGVFCSPILTNAFEKHKTTKPPYDPMAYNRRPPSRHKEPPKSLHLEGEPKENNIRADLPTNTQEGWTSGVNRRPIQVEGGSRWACARSAHTNRRRGSENRPELGVYGQGRAENERSAKATSSAEGNAANPIPWQAVTSTAWTRDGEKEPNLEVNGTAFNSRPMTHVGSLWPSAPRMQVEDVEDLPDATLKNISTYKSKSVFDTRQQKCRSVPFDTKLEPDFLNLFAT